MTSRARNTPLAIVVLIVVVCLGVVAMVIATAGTSGSHPTVTTTTVPSTTTTPTTEPSVAPVMTGYCAPLRAARQQVADAMRGPWFAAARAQTLAVLDADLSECPPL